LEVRTTIPNLLEGVPEDKIEKAVFAICILFDSGVRDPKEIRAYLKTVFTEMWRLR
jgi:hypothetical protein